MDLDAHVLGLNKTSSFQPICIASSNNSAIAPIDAIAKSTIENEKCKQAKYDVHCKV